MQSIFTNRIQELVNKGSLIRPELADVNDYDDDEEEQESPW